jgi:hypothetical protein
MNRIISDDIISRYVTKEVLLNKKNYKSIFRYTGNKLGDTDELEIGFYNENVEFKSVVYLPSMTDNGMYQRNQNMWYPVSLVIPPLHFNKLRGRLQSQYLGSLINNDMYASDAMGFMPEVLNTKPRIMSVLMGELMTEEPRDINDVYNWNVISLPFAIVELYNYKLLQHIRRSGVKGYNGTSGISKSIHTLISAMTRYFGSNNDEIYDESYTTEEVLLNNMIVDDKRDVLVINKLIKQITIENENQPIDFCTCSQSMPMVTARIKSGVTVDGTSFKGKPDFPYAYYRKAIPGILHDDPHRVVVSRAITRAMILDGNNDPYVKTEVPIGVDSVSLPGVRMTHPLNMEDGIIISETMAEAMGAYKAVSSRYNYPASYELTFKKLPCQYENVSLLAKHAAGIISDELDISAEELKGIIVKPGETIAEVRYKDIKGNYIVTPVKSSVKVPSIVTSVDSFVSASDLDVDVITHSITYLAFYPIIIGSKISDAHANKATVSAILPDDKMPIWEGINTHYIATPYIMKRLAVGAEVEDKLALLGKNMRDRCVSYEYNVNSSELWPIDKLNSMLMSKGIRYRGTVMFDGKVYENVPLSYRMMFRLDNNPEDTMIVKHDVVFDDNRRMSKNTKLSLDLVTLAARGANNLMNELIHHSGSRRYMSGVVLPILNAIGDHVPEDAETYEITTRLDRTILGSAISSESISTIVVNGMRIPRDYTDTVADPRCETHYGIIKYRDRKFIVPPHKQFMTLRSGMYLFDSVSVVANRLLAEIISEERVGEELANVQDCITRYYTSLSGMVCGKDGLMRDALLPVFHNSIRTTISPNLSNDPLEIMIPRREFRKLVMKSGDDFEEFYRKKNMCIVKRDPVHRNNNLIGVRFKLWDRNTIGIHPALVKVLDGDYDGDTVCVSFPCTTIGYNDIYKLIPDFKSVYTGSKQLAGVEAEDINKALVENTGWSSTFGNPHKTDILKNKNLFNYLINGLDMERANFECLKAIKDFCCIKDGTAITGALSLRFIFTRDVDDMDLLNEAMELYHMMAQCTLDAKAGTPTPSLDIVDAFGKNRGDVIRRDMKKLGYSNERCIDALVNFSAEVSKSGNMGRFLVTGNPILAITQTNRIMSVDDMKEFAERCINNESFGSGVMEKLFDYILGKTEVTPFDYHVNFGELYRIAKLNNTEELSLVV